VPELGQGNTPGRLLPVGTRLTVRFDSPVDGPVFAGFIPDKPIFDNMVLQERSTADSYSAYLPFSRDLAAGTYTGNIRLLLCRDAACASEYPGSGSLLPYSVTMTPGIQLVVTVNGKQVDTRPVPTRDGDVVQIVSSVPVRWSPSFSGGAGFNPQETPTTWQGTMRYTQSAPGFVGRMFLDAVSNANDLAAHLELQVTE
jgi:hypothetical protein